jgi:hypothetical protein
LIGMSLLEQAPCFATDKHIITMNSQRRHVLRKPNLQNLCRLKLQNNLFRQNTTTKWMYKYTWTATKGKCFRRCLARDVNLWRVFLLLGGVVAIAAIIATVLRVLLTRVAWFFVFGRWLRRRGVFPSFLFFD